MPALAAAKMRLPAASDEIRMLPLPSASMPRFTPCAVPVSTVMLPDAARSTIEPLLPTLVVRSLCNASVRRFSVPSVCT